MFFCFIGFPTFARYPLRGLLTVIVIVIVIVAPFVVG
jgi:hypothetical protein